MNWSGKLVIVGILSVALASAAVSWWFRYKATHRSAQYWGPEATSLIRDAPLVRLCRLEPTSGSAPSLDLEALLEAGAARDVSHARGLVHLRNALLEDRSYHWPPQGVAPPAPWQWALVFGERADSRVALVFSPDARLVAKLPLSGRVLSSEPIAAGLLTMFKELSPALPAR